MSIALSTIPDLRRLSHFVTVVKLQNMTQAATHLRLTQQAVSASIRKLEEQVGAELLNRNGRGVRLTSAGRVLYDGALPLIAASSTLVERIRRQEESAREIFVVGYSAELDEDSVVDILAPVRNTAPQTELELRMLSPAALHAGILRGDLDLALGSGLADDRMVDSAVVLHKELRIAVATHHRLAHKKSISLTDLAGENICVWDPPGESPFTDYIRAMLRYVGVEPKFKRGTFRGSWMSAGVIDTDDVAIVTRQTGLAHGGKVKIVALKDTPQISIQAFWLRHTVSTVRTHLIHLGTNQVQLDLGRKDASIHPLILGDRSAARTTPARWPVSM